MEINKDIIKSLNPSLLKLNNYLYHYENFNGNLRDFLELDNIYYYNKVWIITKLFNRKQNVKFAILCAKSVIDVFEKKYPNDKRPRLALESTEKWLANPTKDNESACKKAAITVYSASYSAPNAAFNAASYAHYASYAYYAYDAACDAAYYACSAAENKKAQEKLNLSFLLEAEKI